MKPCRSRRKIQAVAEPMAAMAATDAVQGNSSNITIGMVDGKPTFVGEGWVTCNPNGKCGQGSGVSLNGDSGDIDLSRFPPGDVAVSVFIGNDAYSAGYRFYSDPYQAVALTLYPQTGPKPDPTFGEPYWPSNGQFGAPSVSSDLRTVSFTDIDNDGQDYEYAVAIYGPGGRVVLDPRISNKNQGR